MYLATGINWKASARIRLYQMIINNNLDIIKADFDVAASRNGHWGSFEKNVSYESFRVSKLF